MNPTLYELLGQWNIQVSVESGNIEEGYSEKAARIREFFLILAICNTVVVAKHPHVDKVREGVISFCPEILIYSLTASYR